MYVHNESQKLITCILFFVQVKTSSIGPHKSSKVADKTKMASTSSSFMSRLNLTGQPFDKLKFIPTTIKR